MMNMPEEESGADIIEVLMEHMDSEELVDRFDHFATHATLSLEDFDDDELEDKGVEYCVIAKKADLAINGKEAHGIYVAIWPVTLAGDSDFLPTHLSRERHARFLEIDPETDLVCDMHPLPTLH
jgi:hypothetical protein